MKRILFLLLLSATVCFSQEKQHNKALLFTLSGLSNVSLGNYVGGAGVKLQDGATQFWTLEFGLKSVDDKTDVSIGAGHFWELPHQKTTFAYLGPSAFYNTATKVWDVDGSFGVEWGAWEDISLSGSYRIAVTLPHDGGSTVATVASGELGVIAYF